ncbi:hypothetical protein SDC9_79903 [bioreactor metagenome]|uniref:Replication-associated protein ORF2/G2P domain-containing protein n=1 Tax=bioreactor metagenome TaxID=1076179 RepID=A0A644YXI4_9ZZZZ
MAKRKNIITAGRLVRGVVYTVALPRDDARARSAKLQVSTAARERMNLKASWEKLEAQLAANFTGRDLHVTLTYRDADLPPDKKEAVKRLKKFLTQLRTYRRARGGSLYYIYVTEDKHGDARIHHHIVLNGTGSDYEIIRSLWIYGDDVDFEPIELPGYTALAKYLTKEPREYGKVEVGGRTWTPSLGLKKPEPDAGFVPDNMTLTAPPGAIILDRDEKHNGFGEFVYIKYLLPAPFAKLPDRYQRTPRKKK